MIGLGTFVNWTCIGPVGEVLLARMYRVPWLCEGDVSFPVRLGIMLLGVLILSLGASMYQTADTGIAHYDALFSISSSAAAKQSPLLLGAASQPTPSAPLQQRCSEASSASAR
ncbi:MAG: hypothetical protein V8S92_01190 [Oscillospiraceae bacterium]